MSAQDFHDETLALLRARYVVRWMHRHDLPATAELEPAESAALFEHANAVAKRFTRRFGAGHPMRGAGGAQ